MADIRATFEDAREFYAQYFASKALQYNHPEYSELSSPARMFARKQRFDTKSREFAISTDRWMSAIASVVSYVKCIAIFQPRGVFENVEQIAEHCLFCSEPFLTLCGARMSDDRGSIIMNEKTYRRVLDAELNALSNP